MSLLPMDYALLQHLSECDGFVPSIAIPIKLFKGDVPSDAPNLTELGLIEHSDQCVRITPAGRLALSSHQLGQGAD